MPRQKSPAHVGSLLLRAPVRELFVHRDQRVLLVGVGFRVVGDCMLMAVVWALLNERWWLLPIFSLVGAISNETFVPLAVVLALGWWLTAFRRGASRRSQPAWIAAMLLVGLGVLQLLMAIGLGHYSPLSFAVSLWAPSGSQYSTSQALTAVLLRGNSSTHSPGCSRWESGAFLDCPRHG